MNKKIPFIDLNTCNTQEELLSGCIENVHMYYHAITKGTYKCFESDNFFHIFILISGTVNLIQKNENTTISSRATFIPAPFLSFSLNSKEKALLLEMRCKSFEGDEILLDEYGTTFPYIIPYEASIQYWDRHKTMKTIPRIMIKQRTIPRVSIGSCESKGPDHIIAHAHPMLDQFFYSFPENNTIVSIDDEKIHFKGNCLLYIPLGSNHGSIVEKDDHLHYVWIDYFVTQDGMDRLDSMHIPTGNMRNVKDL